MSNKLKEAITMLEMLPEQELDFAYEMLKRIVIAWDPDYTKLTQSELRALEEAEADNEYINAKDINWDE